MSKCNQLKFFYRHCFGRCSSELAQLVLLSYSWGRSTCYSDRWHGSSATIPKCYKDLYVNSFFPRKARPSNFLPIECSPLTYDLNEFKFRINRHLSIFATILRCYKTVYVNSFCPCTARLWNYLPIESFSLTYYLNGFKCRISRHLLTVSFFKTDFMYGLFFLHFFFLQL